MNPHQFGINRAWDNARAIPSAPATPSGISTPLRSRANSSYDEAHGQLTSSFAYEADSVMNQELGTWSPTLRSPDSEINWSRDRRVARLRDLERNDGWARGLIERNVDSTVGHIFRLVARPDFATLQRFSPACDIKWANEFAQVAQAEWRLWTEDPMHWCDVTRQMSFTQILALGLRHKLLDGDNLCYLDWDPDSIGAGAARYATRIQVIDPDRLSNPFDEPDTHHRRGGVEINDAGAPIGYHLRRAHQNDMFDADQSVIWDFYQRETAWGRPVIVHDFDRDRATQNRGIGILTSVLPAFKMLARYDAAELAQALLQTVIGTFIESPYDTEQMRLAMQGDETQVNELTAYQSMRAGRELSIGEVRIPSLIPGEKVNFAPPRHPTNNFEAFEHAFLRKAAVATGTTVEEVSGDFSKANYSSLRASMLGAWRTLQRRRANFTVGSVAPIYVAFLEELIDRNPGLLPAGAPPFMSMRAAYARARWIGPGRGWVDPVKERQGAVLGLDAGFGTLEDECANISGADWREQLEQRAIEVSEFKRLGLKLPDWAAQDPASAIDSKPQAQ